MLTVAQAYRLRADRDYRGRVLTEEEREALAEFTRVETIRLLASRSAPLRSALRAARSQSEGST